MFATIYQMTLFTQKMLSVWNEDCIYYINDVKLMSSDVIFNEDNISLMSISDYCDNSHCDYSN